MPLRTLIIVQHGHELGVERFSVPLHLGAHLLRIHSLAFLGWAEVRTVRLHDLMHLASLLFGDAKLLADFWSEQSHCTLLLKVDLLVSLVLAGVQNLLDLVFDLLILGSARPAGATTTRAARATLALSTTLRRTYLSAALALTTSLRRPDLAAALPLSTLGRTTKLAATFAARPSWSTRSAWTTRSAPRHQLAELHLLVFGELKFFLNAGVHEQRWALQAHAPAGTHSRSTAHPRSLRTAKSAALWASLLRETNRTNRGHGHDRHECLFHLVHPFTRFAGVW